MPVAYTTIAELSITYATLNKELGHVVELDPVEDAA
jgi:hypothetical protein